MKEDAINRKSTSKKKILISVAAILLSATVILFCVVAILEREIVYTYEEIAAQLTLHKMEDGFWAETALYPATGFSMSTETISMDEENEIQYVNLYIYLSTKAKNRYFENTSVSPFMALWENGYEWAPVSEYDFDEQGHLIKQETIAGDTKYRVVRQVYYAHFERNYDELIFHTEPVLIWSNETEKGYNNHD